MQTFYLLGLDARYDIIAERIAESGRLVFRSLEKKPSEKALFFLPMGAKESQILSLLDQALPDSIFLMAKTTPEIKAKAQKRGIRCAALFDFESYRIENSAATAEGTLAEIILKTDRCLSDLCVLVYGYGNCGKAIADLLWLSGCEVWIWSRERGRKKALEDGFNLFHAPNLGFSMFDCVINTVPEPIFPDPLLSTMRKNTHFIQIASGLSGIRSEILSERGALFHPLHGLPGKIAPAAEADLIFDIIKILLKEEKERRK